MKKFIFNLTWLSKLQLHDASGKPLSRIQNMDQRVIASNQEEALAIINQKFGKWDELKIEYKGEWEIRWMATRADVERGAWCDDEYEWKHSNYEMLGPFDTSEEAMQAIREEWGYLATLTKYLDCSYSSTDTSLDVHKEYTVHPVNRSGLGTEKTEGN